MMITVRWLMKSVRVSFASVLEVIGVGLISVGLWAIHPLAALIAFGAFCIFIAQGLQRGGSE
jgi:ABC-type proline/glycine betaine transport system permease subunit